MSIGEVESKTQQTGAAKLMIEEPKQSYQPSAFVKTPADKQTASNTPGVSTAKPQTANSSTGTGVKGGLSRIRQKISDENNLVTTQSKPIDAEQLSIAWQEFILKLKTAQKHSVVSTMEMMECKMKSEEVFEVICYGNIQLGFLKQEKTPLLEHMQHFFHNPSINIHVELVEAPEENNPVDRPLSTKEQFMKMTEKYPLVKELKDRLGMELDY